MKRKHISYGTALFAATLFLGLAGSAQHARADVTCKSEWKKQIDILKEGLAENGVPKAKIDEAIAKIIEKKPAMVTVGICQVSISGPGSDEPITVGIGGDSTEQENPLVELLTEAGCTAFCSETDQTPIQGKLATIIFNATTSLKGEYIQACQQRDLYKGMCIQAMQGRAGGGARAQPEPMSDAARNMFM